MTEINERKEYLKLFKGRGEGYYLYKPLEYEELHPGCIGFLDDNMIWNPIADLSDPKDLTEKGFSGLHRSLSDLYRSECTWNTRTSETESERSYRGKAGASGAAAGAPVEGSGELKYKTGSNGKAALVADGLVKLESYRVPFELPVEKWVQRNADAILDLCGNHVAREHGIIAVKSVWVTDSCAITMSSGSSHDIDTALDVGATGIGKLGGGAAFIDKLSTEGWTTYKSKEGSKGRVVSFDGMVFKPRKLTKWFSSDPFRQVSIETTMTKSASAEEEPVLRPIFDKDENIVGFEKVKPVKNDACEWEYQKVPEGAHAEQEDNKETAEGEGYAMEVNEMASQGISQEEIEEEKRYQEAEKKKADQEKLEKWKRSVEHLEHVNKKLRESGQAERERKKRQEANELIANTSTTTHFTEIIDINSLRKE